MKPTLRGANNPCGASTHLLIRRTCRRVGHVPSSNLINAHEMPWGLACASPLQVKWSRSAIRLPFRVLASARLKSPRRVAYPAVTSLMQQREMGTCVIISSTPIPSRATAVTSQLTHRPKFKLGLLLMRKPQGGVSGGRYVIES